MEVPEKRWERTPREERLRITKELFSADVPWGLYNMVPQSFKDALILIDPKWMGYKEETITKKADPGDREELLRLAFWTEYNIAKDLNKPMAISRVLSGVCSDFYFKHSVLTKPRLLAYIVMPPTNYLNFMKSMLYKGQQRMRDIMRVSAVDEIEVEDPKTGKKIKKQEVNMKLANLQLKTFALIDNRVKGAIVQRVSVEQKNLNVNVDASTLKDATPTTVIDIDKQLMQIERELARSETLLNANEVVKNAKKTHIVSKDKFEILDVKKETKQ